MMHDRQHHTFWLAAPERRDRLRDLVNAVCLALHIGPREIVLLLPPKAEAGGDDLKNVRRFLRSEGNSFSRNPERLTQLARSVLAHCADRAPELEATRELQRLVEELDESFARSPDAPAALRPHPGNTYSRDELRAILDNIHEAESEDDPARPEFPHRSPRYPATPIISLDSVGFPNVWIKDESYCPTGSHKDRWAWERLLLYKAEILKLMHQGRGMFTVPQLSMISSGSAALALQTLLRLYGLPPLRVVVDDRRAPPEIMATLKTIGALVFHADLDQRQLESGDVLAITQNLGGWDITTRDVTEPSRWRFFDWLSYELLSEEPDHIFVPFGTGDLFTNIVYVIVNESRSKMHDRRLKNPCKRGINVLGATTFERQSRMDKLYAPFRPTKKALDHALAEWMHSGVLGPSSGIYEVADGLADDAREIARRANIQTELSGIAGLALYLKCREKIPSQDKVVVVNTGWLRTSPRSRRIGGGRHHRPSR